MLARCGVALPSPRPSSSMKTVLQYTLAFLIAFGLAILLLGGAGLLFVGAVVASASPEVPAGCILTVDFSMPVGERGGAPRPLDVFKREAPYPLPGYEIAAVLRHAATDARIKGVLLTGAVRGSPSALALARTALAELRAAKKPVLAYYGAPDERALWFGSAADELWMEPLAEVQFDGLALEIPYFGDALARYGVEVQVTRVGKYKSAVEPYLLGHMSAENREQLEAVLGDVEGALYGDIAAARAIELAQLRALARESGWLTPEQAIELGLVTRAAPYRELLARLRTITGVGADEEVPQVALRDYAADVWTNGSSRGRGVLVIVAAGEIVDGTSPHQIGGDDLARALRAARLDDSVAAVVLRVDSPGGSATASDVIRAEVLALREAQKQVIVSMGSMAASGGYWISAEADQIVAQPETLTGSIGVFGMLPNIQQLAESHGLRAEVVRTGPLAGIESFWCHKDAAQLARLQALVDRIYERFVALVAAGRHLAPERVQELAQGRVWSGRRALELGLVDELGDLTRAIALACERAHLPADAPVRYERDPSNALDEFLQQVVAERLQPLTRSLAEPLAPLAALEPLLARLRELVGRTGVVARLPFDFEVR
ncbi:MAG: signal peptide peptidase SppA [Planctomycetes bacterium]|nr:signal peptide peptidase SppA [Planctomycetota bacterium]